MEGSGYHVLCAMSICRTNSRLLCRPLFIVAVGVISGSHHANPTLIFRLAAFKMEYSFLITEILRLTIATSNQRQAEGSTPEVAASSHHELSVFERKAP